VVIPAAIILGGSYLAGNILARERGEKAAIFNWRLPLGFVAGLGLSYAFVPLVGVMAASMGIGVTIGLIGSIPFIITSILWLAGYLSVTRRLVGLAEPGSKGAALLQGAYRFGRGLTVNMRSLMIGGTSVIGLWAGLSALSLENMPWAVAMLMSNYFLYSVLAAGVLVSAALVLGVSMVRHSIGTKDYVRKLIAGGTLTRYPLFLRLRGLGKNFSSDTAAIKKATAEFGDYLKSGKGKVELGDKTSIDRTDVGPRQAAIAILAYHANQAEKSPVLSALLESIRSHAPPQRAIYSKEEAGFVADTAVFEIQKSHPEAAPEVLRTALLQTMRRMGLAHTPVSATLEYLKRPENVSQALGKTAAVAVAAPMMGMAPGLVAMDQTRAAAINMDNEIKASYAATLRSIRAAKTMTDVDAIQSGISPLFNKAMRDRIIELCQARRLQLQNEAAMAAEDKADVEEAGQEASVFLGQARTAFGDFVGRVFEFLKQAALTAKEQALSQREADKNEALKKAQGLYGEAIAAIETAEKALGSNDPVLAAAKTEEALGRLEDVRRLSEEYAIPEGVKAADEVKAYLALFKERVERVRSIVEARARRMEDMERLQKEPEAVPEETRVILTREEEVREVADEVTAKIERAREVSRLDRVVSPKGVEYRPETVTGIVLAVKGDHYNNEGVEHYREQDIRTGSVNSFLADGYKFYFEERGWFWTSHKVYCDPSNISRAVFAEDKDGNTYVVSQGRIRLLRGTPSEKRGPSVIIQNEMNLSDIYDSRFRFLNSEGRDIQLPQMEGDLLRIGEPVAAQEVSLYTGTIGGKSSRVVTGTKAKPVTVAVAESRGWGEDYSSLREKHVIGGRDNPVFSYPTEDTDTVRHSYYGLDDKGREYRIDNSDPENIRLRARVYVREEAGRKVRYELKKAYMAEMKADSDRVNLYLTYEQARKRHGEFRNRFFDESGRVAWPFSIKSIETIRQADMDLVGAGLSVVETRGFWGTTRYTSFEYGPELGGVSLRALAESGRQKDVLDPSRAAEMISEGWTFYDAVGSVLHTDDPELLSRAVKAVKVASKTDWIGRTSEGTEEWKITPIYFMAVTAKGERVTASNRVEFMEKFGKARFLGMSGEEISISEVRGKYEITLEAHEKEELETVLDMAYTGEEVHHVLYRGREYSVKRGSEIDAKFSRDGQMPRMLWVSSDGSDVKAIYTVDDVVDMVLRGMQPVDANGEAVYNRDRLAAMKRSFEGNPARAEVVRSGMSAMLRRVHAEASASPDGALVLDNMMDMAMHYGNPAQEATFRYWGDVAEILGARAGRFDLKASIGASWAAGTGPGWGGKISFTYTRDPARQDLINAAVTNGNRSWHEYQQGKLDRAMQVFLILGDMRENNSDRDNARRQKQKIEEVIPSPEEARKKLADGRLTREQLGSLNAARQQADADIEWCDTVEMNLRRQLVALGVLVSPDSRIDLDGVTIKAFIERLERDGVLGELNIPSKMLEQQLNIVWAGHKFQEAAKGCWMQVFGLEVEFGGALMIMLKPVLGFVRKGDLNKPELTTAMAGIMMREQQINYLRAAKQFRDEKALILDTLPLLEELLARVEQNTRSLEDGLARVTAAVEQGGLDRTQLLEANQRLREMRQERDTLVRELESLKVKYESALKDLEKLIGEAPAEETRSGVYREGDAVRDALGLDEEKGDLAWLNNGIAESRQMLQEAEDRPLLLFKKIMLSGSYNIPTSGGDSTFGAGIDADIQVKGPGWKYFLRFLRLDVRIKELEAEYVKQNMPSEIRKAFLAYLDAQSRIRIAEERVGARERVVRDAEATGEALKTAAARSELAAARNAVEAAKLDQAKARANIRRLTGRDFEEIDPAVFNVPVAEANPRLRLQILELRRQQAEAIVEMTTWSRAFSLAAGFSWSRIAQGEDRVNLNLGFADDILGPLSRSGYIDREQAILLTARWDSLLRQERNKVDLAKETERARLDEAREDLRFSLENLALKRRRVRDLISTRETDLFTTLQLKPYDISLAEAEVVDAADGVRAALNEYAVAVTRYGYRGNLAEVVGSMARESWVVPVEIDARKAAFERAAWVMNHIAVTAGTSASKEFIGSSSALSRAIEEAEGQDEKTRQDIRDLEKIIGPVEHWEQFLFQDASGRWHIKHEYQTPDPEDILNKMVGRLNDLTDKE
ncbi:MAG: TolC family protein, partial [Candidatus Omnitrophica bacterium]|nr:TolC family protein [Candidatus Omnitrophota bacterium]